MHKAYTSGDIVESLFRLDFQLLPLAPERIATRKIGVGWIDFQIGGQQLFQFHPAAPDDIRDQPGDSRAYGDVLEYLTEFLVPLQIALTQPTPSSTLSPLALVALRESELERAAATENEAEFVAVQKHWSWLLSRSAMWHRDYSPHVAFIAIGNRIHITWDNRHHVWRNGGSHPIWYSTCGDVSLDPCAITHELARAFSNLWRELPTHALGPAEGTVAAHCRAWQPIIDEKLTKLQRLAALLACSDSAS